jgi:hypothetical protein
MLWWTRARRGRIALLLLVGSGGVLLPGIDSAGAAGPTVVASPTTGLSWGATITVTTSGYPTQEASYITLCEPGTIGKVLTVQADFGVGSACNGELEHRFDSGFNPNTNYGFINGANGSDTVLLTDGRVSSGHCGTGKCDLVVFDHNCVDQPPGTQCTFLGQPLTFSGPPPGVNIKGNGATLTYKPAKVRAHWTAASTVACTLENAGAIVTNASRHTVQPTYQGAPFGGPLPAGTSEGFCMFGTGRATYQFGLEASTNILTVKVS